MKCLDIISSVKVYNFDECDELTQNLIEKSKQATQTSYAPYSGFNVGAAVLLANGEIICGSNQENAAYPSGLCAERTALFYANAQYPNVAVEAIAISAFNGTDFTDDVCTPCGSCRQVLVEVETRAEKPVRIIMYGKREIYEVASINAILPLSFGKTNLE